jgi:hypothetical protein
MRFASRLVVVSFTTTRTVGRHGKSFGGAFAGSGTLLSMVPTPRQLPSLIALTSSSRTSRFQFYSAVPGEAPLPGDLALIGPFVVVARCVSG